MRTTIVHALHGTLQTPAVWSDLVPRLRRVGDADALSRTIVMAETIEAPRDGGLAEWAAAFCRRVGATDTLEDEDLPRRVLLGYSLGGRLALHALLSCPHTWAAAVLVSAHPGSANHAERAALQERDAAWADRCRREPLSTVLADWDAQAVFGGRPNRAPRAPGELQPERCARTFEAFSRGRQSDLRPLLGGSAASGRLPAVLYVTGAGDPRYVAIGKELERRVATLEHRVVADAGHRVPWDRPDTFARTVAEFLQHL